MFCKNTIMFAFLPEEIERIIWKMYYSSEVILKINSKSFIWKNPSQELLDKTNELGCYQKKYSDMEKYIFCKQEHSDLRQAITNCFIKDCGNCNAYGFPCSNATIYGNLNNKNSKKWKITY